MTSLCGVLRPYKLDKPLKSVTHGQCEARPTVTFPTAGHHHPLTGTKLHCLVTEAQSFVLLYFRLFTFSDLYWVCSYFPVLFCLSVSVKWLAVKTASEMTSIVSGGALNSTQTKTKRQRHMCVNNLPKVVTWKRNGRESNPLHSESQVKRPNH